MTLNCKVANDPPIPSPASCAALKGRTHGCTD